MVLRTSDFLRLQGFGYCQDAFVSILHGLCHKSLENARMALHAVKFDAEWIAKRDEAKGVLREFWRIMFSRC